MAECTDFVNTSMPGLHAVTEGYVDEFLRDQEVVLPDGRPEYAAAAKARKSPPPSRPGEAQDELAVVDLENGADGIDLPATDLGYERVIQEEVDQVLKQLLKSFRERCTQCRYIRVPPEIEDWVIVDMTFMYQSVAHDAIMEELTLLFAPGTDRTVGWPIFTSMTLVHTTWDEYDVPVVYVGTAYFECSGEPSTDFVEFLDDKLRAYDCLVD